MGEPVMAKKAKKEMVSIQKQEGIRRRIHNLARKVYPGRSGAIVVEHEKGKLYIGNETVLHTDKRGWAAYEDIENQLKEKAGIP
jgi:hypothetical protein